MLRNTSSSLSSQRCYRKIPVTDCPGLLYVLDGLLIVQDCLWCELAQFKLCAHLAQSLSKRFNVILFTLSTWLRFVFQRSVRDGGVLTGSTLYGSIEQFHQARFVRFTHRRLPIWLDPVGMLAPQIIADLFQQVRIRVDFPDHSHIDSAEDSSVPGKG